MVNVLSNAPRTSTAAFCAHDRLATMPLLRMAALSASAWTASACNQALAQADGDALTSSATNVPHPPLGPPPSPVMQVQERRALHRQLARGIVHAAALPARELV